MKQCARRPQGPDCNVSYVVGSVVQGCVDGWLASAGANLAFCAVVLHGGPPGVAQSPRNTAHCAQNEERQPSNS